MKKAFKLFKRIIGVLILWFLIHSVLIIYDGLRDKNQNADVAIVLGNKINTDGTPSERLKARLDKSLELYEAKRINKIIVSGGFGIEGFWEGDKMKQYLESKNIPSDKIIVDNYGNDTEKTVENSIRIMDSLNIKSAVSVSQYFHQTRTKQLFRKHHFKNIESSSPNYFEMRDFYSVIREFLAFYADLL
ncbi:hypothetical protein ASG31_00665 [Chryseobacterium sp. Leaf404]|uniref:YdcF family protein n=1 Tax=unclassified Chryseobacterium TaxID=2593645 RepID=UPI0006FAA0E2|nr:MULTISPECIES: YdcF family protein [unclassified Chryseobacterium]KQT21889.1 hypothetical protein ASG31_00665 [Chryseobacterium sp. Leaf404]